MPRKGDRIPEEKRLRRQIVYFDPQTREELEELALDRELSKSEMIRQGVRLLFELRSELRRGNRIMVHTRSGRIRPVTLHQDPIVEGGPLRYGRGTLMVQGGRQEASPAHRKDTP